MRKTSQKKIRRLPSRETRFDLLIEAVETIQDYAIFMLDPDGYILTWNSGAERIKGYTEKEAVGKHFSIFYPPERKASGYPEWELKEAKKVGQYQEEGWRIRKDGTYFWSSVVITKLTDKSGSLLGFSKVTRDLSERKIAETKILESEERFRLLVDGVKDYAIFMLNPEGIVTSWNEGARRIIGYEDKDILGKHFSIFYPEEDSVTEKCVYELKEAMVTGRFEDEGWRVRKDSTMLWANVVITAIRDKNKKLLGFTKVTRDLTERKRAEDKLQRAYEDLEKRIQLRTADLAEVNQRLKEKTSALEEAVRVRDEFLSIASHELRTPMTSLKMQIQMLQRRTKTELGLVSPPPERLGNALDVSLRQIDRLTRLVEDLLDVTRAQTHGLSFNFEQSDLKTLVQEVIGRLSEQLASANCTIKFNSEETIEGYFDYFRMDQVVVNLLTNAIKYAPGSIIEIFIRKQNSTAVLIIRDSGPGISQDKHAKIFERFERATTSRNISGLGLGLYITKQIVEGHHGSIRVESEPGKGATFIVEVPLNLISVTSKPRNSLVS